MSMEPSEADELSFGRDEIIIPGFQTGGRVERTGIALVHEGEYIMPAPGSEALISPELDGAGAGQVINYYFPVEIEIVGTLNEEQMNLVADHIFNALETELASRI